MDGSIFSWVKPVRTILLGGKLGFKQFFGWVANQAFIDNYQVKICIAITNVFYNSVCDLKTFEDEFDARLEV